jgi:hypothetical protein
MKLSLTSSLQANMSFYVVHTCTWILERRFKGVVAMPGSWGRRGGVAMVQYTGSGKAVEVPQVSRVLGRLTCCGRAVHTRPQDTRPSFCEGCETHKRQVLILKLIVRRATLEKTGQRDRLVA